jgi:hypothetical protein
VCGWMQASYGYHIVIARTRGVLQLATLPTRAEAFCLPRGRSTAPLCSMHTVAWHLVTYKEQQQLVLLREGVVRPPLPAL